jgi:hypothetical protein
MAAQEAAQEHARLLREAVKSAVVDKAKGSSAQAYQNLVREISQLRRKYESRRDQETEFGLISLIKALSSSITYLRERKHEALVSEVLAIKLWTSSKVIGAEFQGPPGLELGLTASGVLPPYRCSHPCSRSPPPARSSGAAPRHGHQAARRPAPAKPPPARPPPPPPSLWHPCRSCASRSWSCTPT